MGCARLDDNRDPATGLPDGYEKPEDLVAKTLAMTLFGGDELVAG
jgi:hypothetical protein